ncbi:MAG: histidine phosphatase family protein [Bacillota bacterium]
MTKLYLVRHGETAWNTEKRTQGSMNIALSEKGRLQAEVLAHRLKNFHIDRIYSSDLDRAYQTGCIIGNIIGQEVEKINELQEMSFGQWEGLTAEEIKKDFHEEFVVWRNKPHEANIPGGEALLQVQKRGLDAVYKLVKLNPNKNIMIVSHGIMIKAIILGMLDIDFCYFYKIRQDNTALNIIDFLNQEPVLVTLNDISHLENIE